MKSYTEIDGNLIVMAKNGEFDVITHGCNCFCRMKTGLAPQMAEAFGCNKFPLESKKYEGDINKLGQIESKTIIINDFEFDVINSYTQYTYSRNKVLDYDALRLCLRKINHKYNGKTIGIPKIGAGLAGGDIKIIKKIIREELKNMNIKLINYEK